TGIICLPTSDAGRARQRPAEPRRRTAQHRAGPLARRLQPPGHHANRRGGSPMKSSTWILAGLTLAGGTALALQETGTQQQHDPESSVVTEEEQQDRTDSYGSSTATQESDPYSTQTEDDAPSGDPEMGTLPEGETNAYGAETGEQ